MEAKIKELSGHLSSYAALLLNNNENRSVTTLVQLMHSQMTDFQPADLSLDRRNKLVLSSSQQNHGMSSECLSIHSLDADIGIFAPR